jgi:hypothetical protein
MDSRIAAASNPTALGELAQRLSVALASDHHALLGDGAL